MSFLDNTTFTSEPHLLRALKGQVTDVLPACVSLGDHLFTSMANLWA